ncbi:MAG: hypothetical protein ABSE73_25295 [Planctomycetota bacterium]
MRSLILLRIASLILLLLSVCTSGCGTRVVYLQPGEPVRLAEPVQAKVWVPDKSGVQVKSDNAVEVPEGWYVLPDPGLK